MSPPNRGFVRPARATVVRGHRWGGECCRLDDFDLEWAMSVYMAPNGKRIIGVVEVDSLV